MSFTHSSPDSWCACPASLEGQREAVHTPTRYESQHVPDGLDAQHVAVEVEDRQGAPRKWFQESPDGASPDLPPA